MVKDEIFMEMCIKEAECAFAENEVPVGAVIITGDQKVIAKTHNLTIHLNSAVAHAEILAIGQASEALNNYRLKDCTLFVTKEPCIMCAGAIIEARIGRIVFGCFDGRRGAFGSLIDVNRIPLNHKVKVRGGVFRERNEALLREFFELRRGTEAAVTGPTRNRLYAL